MENAKELLRGYGVPENELAEVAFDVANAVNDMWELEDVKFIVEEELELSLTEPQLREVLAWWKRSESYGHIDREGIEWAVNKVMKKE